MSHQTELDRIQQEYRRRSQDKMLSSLYSPFTPGHLYTSHRLEQALLAVLKRINMQNLADKQILDIGTGSGGHLQKMVAYGAIPSNLAGIDLMADRAKAASQMLPRGLVSQSNAGELPFASQSFDITLMFTVLTSVLDSPLKVAIANEAIRICKPGGIIIVYDFKHTGRNLHQQGVKPDEISALFPEQKVQFRSVTLMMSLAWRLAPHSFILCRIVEKIPLFRSHYLATIQPK